MRDVVYRIRLHVHLQQDVLILRFHKSCAGHAGRVTHGANYVIQRKTIAMQFLRIDLNLPLAHVPAKYVHFRHAAHRHQVRTNHPIDQRAQFHQTALTGSDADTKDSACR